MNHLGLKTDLLFIKEKETKKIEKILPTEVKQEKKVSPPEKGTDHLKKWSTLTTSFTLDANTQQADYHLKH